ncbi:pentapeptide repeat-containing protein [Chryseobacterium sp. PMSZPI]|uniref:pentapeptide repeat-containing protein n=1 Tax=Chryseobacterium sp. PMSZPI TaxID=1033900 RepID=UPI000C32749D|nr:pentapeptide repeat-containing protein [Chryseobacterium sp. PMSZPI]PKF73862.1 Cro/Cl family transcriptional regulator [Chryseobacterium sp. PMSZPI]
MDIKKLGDKIVHARKENRMSQAQLAQLLFISPQAVGKWERGESVPDFITINRLSEIFNLDLNYFSENVPSQKDGAVIKNTANITDQAEQKNSTEITPSISVNEPLLTDFSGGAFVGTDFAEVNAPERKFWGSDLKGADFSKANLSGSSFKNSDVSDGNFESADLTDCVLSNNNLSGTNFNKAVLLRTEFSSSDLTQARFTNINLIDVRLVSGDLRKTIFENCEFDGVDFSSSDMSGICLDRQLFINVKFDNARLKGVSFKGSALKNVSFRSTFALTNRYYKTLKSIDFEGAMMDKLTYAALRGAGVDLPNVITV